MKVFHCDHCGHLLFFENTQCLRCGRLAAYLPDLGLVGSLDAVENGVTNNTNNREGAHDTVTQGTANTEHSVAEQAANAVLVDTGTTEQTAMWQSPLAAAAGRTYRLCRNYTEHHVCNWAVVSEDPNPLCVSCRLTRVVPDLAPDANRQAWYRLEVAKRRLIFTLLQLRLPIVDRDEDPRNGLAFEFKADDPSGEVVMTGHANGLITVNIAEADDAERERRKASLHEPYRTLAGHMRHEVGHYYWDQLIALRGEHDAFRAVFGDERPDYGQALQNYYAAGPPADWQNRFISAYASAHPLEDWAETWAHYLHMVDTLETAAACGISLRPRRSDEPSLPRVSPFVLTDDVAFDRLIDSWFPVTYMLNNLNRGMGLPDAYPFVWSVPAVEKLRFVHELVARVRQTS
jgi:hypothetical protein